MIATRSASPRAGALGGPWLVRLRWAALVAQLGVVLITHYGVAAQESLAWLLALIAMGALSNLALAWSIDRGERSSWIGPAILLDVLLLTLMLHLGGGSSNPFALVFLVHVTLAAVAAGATYTWVVVASTSLGYATLFLWTPSPRGDAHAHHMHHAMGGGAETFDAHLQGMWVAFALAAVLIAYFVTRLASALALERERSARAARLAGLTTLAAGAAHELATPLGTIKVVARELELSLEAQVGSASSLVEDARLVRQETERCRSILDRLAVASGELRGEAPEPTTLIEIADELAQALPPADAARLDVDVSQSELRAPRRVLVQALSSLVRNALDAGPGRVSVQASATGGVMSFVITDTGEGMSEEVLSRVGEPFFTTRETGRGMGLGVFLARAVAEQLGGSLELESTPGSGTRVILRVALDAARGGDV